MTLQKNTFPLVQVEEKGLSLYKEILQSFISIFNSNTQSLDNVNFNTKIEIEILFSKIMLMADSDFYKELLTILFYPLLDNNNKSIEGISFDFVSDNLLREKYLNLFKQGEFLAHVHYYIDYINKNINILEDKSLLKNFRTKSSLNKLDRLQKLVFLSYLLELLLNFILNNTWNLRQKQKINRLLKIFNVK